MESKKSAKQKSKKVTKVEEPKTTKPKRRRTAAKKKKPKTKKPIKEHYVNAKVFYEQIKTYYETDIIPDELAESINKIAKGLSFAPNFINYSYKDEMIGDAILKMFSAIRNKKFDVSTKNNPFSYFTTIAFHAFINRIKKEKKHRETIVKYQEKYYFDTIHETEANIYIDSTSQDQED
tara:strand:+ start:245 stop:778 length:534 start_codon:yes stop_codon:yes gene_type:complete